MLSSGLEATIRRDPYSVKAWLSYAKATESFRERRIVYERALRYVPLSYKIWTRYLDDYEEAVRERWLTSKRAKTLCRTYERALVHLHKMPRIWLRYLGVVVRLGDARRARLAFDECLRALPITQHELVWPEYMEFAKQAPEIGIPAYRRYVMYDPQRREEMADYASEHDPVLAARELAKCVESEPSASRKLWMRLIDTCSKIDGDTIDVEAAVRDGLSRFTDQVGSLWCKLADYFTRSGRFESARDVYEEAVTTVMTVRDFSLVFDAYATFLESLVETDYDLARLEKLVESRPLLLSSVILRQNPHNVHEWLARADLASGAADRLRTLAEAVRTVDPKQSVVVGKPEHLWIAMASAYDLENARIVYTRALEKMPDNDNLWCSWTELELENEHHDEALAVVQRGVRRRQKSPRLWSLYLDLEESFGTFETAKAAYQRTFDLKVATPQIVLNFAQFLRDNDYFEESFKAYEKGVAIFRWPRSKDIWMAYIDFFLDRHKVGKLERTRDLFEQALAKGGKNSHELYVKYARFEEDRGTIRKAIDVYRRAAEVDSSYDSYALYAAKVSHFFGLAKARPVYEAAIQRLEQDFDCQRMCLKLVDLETKLGEIDRARAVLGHGSQFAPTDQSYWDTFRAFEVRHGNEDTFRDMLRIKRSAEVAHNVHTYQPGRHQDDDEEEIDEEEEEPVPKKARVDEEIPAPTATPTAAREEDPNEIDLDDDDDDVEEKPVPASVFGGETGALARFKNRL